MLKSTLKLGTMLAGVILVVGCRTTTKTVIKTETRERKLSQEIVIGDDVTSPTQASSGTASEAKSVSAKDVPTPVKEKPVTTTTETTTEQRVIKRSIVVE